MSYAGCLEKKVLSGGARRVKAPTGRLDTAGSTPFLGLSWTAKPAPPTPKRCYDCDEGAL